MGMDVTPSTFVHDQLVERREKLQAAVAAAPPRPDLVDLLEQVDSALERLQTGTYGLCESCHEPIEVERLTADPLVRFCLDHLTPDEQRALEHDLELAASIQQALLPPPLVTASGWQLAYRYEPARIVSGDYCDIIAEADGVYFLLGDVSGKGIAASMLMSHLHAMIRTLASLHLPLERLMEQASRLFCESTLPNHYATLVCGRASAGGALEICTAGHVPPILVRGGAVTLITTAGLPLGMFCSEQFSVERVQLDGGDTIVLVTDGVSDAEDTDGREYGIDRLTALVHRRSDLAVADLVAECVKDVAAYSGPVRRADDVTVLAVRRALR